MRTLQRAQQIATQNPRAATADALGLAAVAVLIFAGFVIPAFL